MHNNAIGPELCGPAPAGDAGWVGDGRRNFYRSPYVATSPDGRLVLDDKQNPVAHPEPPACWPFDPSVDGRFELFVASTRALLNPDQRVPKITRLAEDVIVPIGPRYVLNEEDQTGIEIRLPAGTPAIYLANLNHKELIGDLVLAATDPEALEARWQRQLAGEGGADEAAEAVRRIRAMLTAIVKAPGNSIDIIDVLRDHRDVVQGLYSNSTAIVENEGHEFGATLTDQQKNDLTAFLATL